MIYRGLIAGVGSQMIAFMGWFLLVFASIEWYDKISNVVFSFLLQSWSKPAGFVGLIVLVVGLIKFLEKMFNITVEDDIAALERFFGAAISAGRAGMLYGSISLLILLFPINGTYPMIVEKSKTAMFFVKMDVSIYCWIKRVWEKGEAVDPNGVIEVFLDEARKSKGSD